MSQLTPNKPVPASPLLTNKERLLTGAVACGCLVLALLAALCPATLETMEIGAQGVITRQAWSQEPRTELALFLGAVGLLLLCFAINGLRLTKLTIGSTSVETHKPATEALEDFAKQHPGAINQVAEPIPGIDPDPALTAPRQTKVLSGETYYVYEIDEIPLKVIAAVSDQWTDAVKNVPGASPAPPNTLSRVQFAARKSGKGNFPWLIAFDDAPPVRVSLGGQGKNAPTVTVLAHQLVAGDAAPTSC